MISPDLLLTFAPDCLSSSSQPLLTSIGVNGYKPQYYHQLFAFLWPSSDDHYTSLWLQAVIVSPVQRYISFCWILLEKGTASVHPHITLLRVGIHSCRDFIYLAVGLWVWKIDSNSCPYLLSPTAPAPRTRCIGDSVARFARPFESRPTDSVRREVFRQLAARPGPATSSGRIAPSATLPATPRPLQRVTERCSPRTVPAKLKGKQRLQF